MGLCGDKMASSMVNDFCIVVEEDQEFLVLIPGSKIMNIHTGIENK
jgi:hypothetical protein